MAPPYYHRPGTPEEVSLLLQETGARLLAGGTDLLVQMRSGEAPPSSLIDLGGLASLAEIRPSPGGGVRIGAMVRLSHLIAHELCRPYPALLEAAATVGSVQIRNRATLVGNVCNGSPAADTAPALLVYEATVNIMGPDGRRAIRVEDFWRGPGNTVLKSGEWVESISLPQPPRHGGCYLKLGRTLGTDLAIAGVAMCVTSKDTRVALASVAPTPVRARSIEAILNTATRELPTGLGAAIESAINPIDDLRASARYRRAMTLVLVERAWRTARERLADASGSPQ